MSANGSSADSDHPNCVEKTPEKESKWKCLECQTWYWHLKDKVPEEMIDTPKGRLYVCQTCRPNAYLNRRGFRKRR